MILFNGKKIFIDDKGYPRISINRKNIPVHRIVWQQANGNIPSGFEIHHRNGIKTDYTLSNLELLTRKEHSKRHLLQKGWIEENGRWISKPCASCQNHYTIKSFKKLKNGLISSWCEECKEKYFQKYWAELDGNSLKEHREKSKFRMRKLRAYRRKLEESK